jgi:hypothetical protein
MKILLFLEKNENMKNTGSVLMIVAVVICAYGFLGFSIVAPGSDTINMGLLDDRRNVINAGFVLAIIGAIFYCTGEREIAPEVNKEDIFEEGE